MEKGQTVWGWAGLDLRVSGHKWKEEGQSRVKGRVLGYGRNPKVLRLASLCQRPVLAGWNKQKVTVLTRQEASRRF